MSRYHINRFCILLILISAIVFQFTIAGSAGNIGTEVKNTVKTLESIYLIMTSPNGEDNLIKGTTNTITWSSYGSPGTYVRIELLKNDSRYRLITARTPNDGSYNWRISSAFGVGDNYKVRITSTSNSKYNDTSDNNFYIVNPIIPTPSITVTSPNGGETLMKGTTNTIRWSSYSNPGLRVKIELLKGGVLNKIISSSTYNGGSYNWNISSTQVLGSNYKIRITSVSNSKYNDTSDNNFTIGSLVPPIHGMNQIVSVKTDKLVYSQESLINFTIKNIGRTSVWINSNPVKIRDIKTGTIVYDPSIDICPNEPGIACVLSSLAYIDIEIKSGDTYKWTWNQNTNTGYAGSGTYQGIVELPNKEHRSNVFIVR